MRDNAEVIIAPSILNANFSCLKEVLEQLACGGASWIHFDIMDGHFVPNLTFGPQLVHSLRSCSSLFFDVHLMVENPSMFVKPFADAGADLITFHYESEHFPFRMINYIKKLGKKVGVALNPVTPVEVVFPLLTELDLVLIMSVEPGFGGQSFIISIMPKIKKLAKEIGKVDKKVYIQVDGGIDLSNALQVYRAGAEVLVVGTGIFRETDISRAVKEIKEKINGEG